MERAYALLHLKSADAERRVITGIATTPTPDRVGDVIDPFGVTVAPDIPLLLYHDTRQPVGRARFGKATAAGIPFEATLPKVMEPGTLKDRVDEAWAAVKYRLITGVSVGFRVVGGAMERLKSGGILYKACEVIELSLTPTPMNAEATIATVKAADFALHAARRPGVVYLNDPPRRRGVVYLDRR